MSAPGVREQKVIMAWSLGIAVVLLALKVAAAGITGSSAIFSDAAESVVHVLAVGFAVWALRVSLTPADDDHHFGHEKAEFMSAGFEGAMISMAALMIFYQAGKQALTGVELANLWVGTVLTASAAAVNLALGLALVQIGKRRGSMLLLANGLHVLTDVWTSVAALMALGLILATGWMWWDPIIAGLAGANILRTGLRLMRQSYFGLMDTADPETEQELRDLLECETATRGLSFHNLRHRCSGRTHWVELHLVFPDTLTVREAHAAATAIEARVAASLTPRARVISHLEPQSQENAVEEWESR